jgi:NifB/MoaA-like Fe-S oxidoreductase
MVRAFANDFARVTKRLERDGDVNKKPATIFTGTLFAPVLREMIDQWNSRFETRLRVEPLENSYFGGDVSVAGLLTGRDLLAARDRVRGEFVLIPKQMLKSDDAIMLDGMRIAAVAEAFGCPVYAVSLEELAALLLNKN